METSSLLHMVEMAYAEGTNRYIVEFQFLDRVLGTQPKSKDVMVGWLRGKHVPDDIIAQQAAAMGAPADALDKVDEATERAWTGFFTDEKGPWIGCYQVEAMFRELLSSLGFTVERRGSKQTLQHLFDVWACDALGLAGEGVDAARLHFLRPEGVVSAPDGWIEMTAHVQTPMGPRSIVKRHDYIAGARIRFLLIVPALIAEARASAVIDDEVLARCLAHAGGDGLGCSRSQGFGQFKVVRFDKLTDNAWIRKKAGGKKKDDDNGD